MGNSPLNFTDPSGYCFMGCFWNSAFKGIGAVFRRMPILGSILQIAAGAVCSAIGGPGAGAACASAASAFVAGVTSGNLGAAIRAGLISAATAFAFNAVGDFTGHQPNFLTAEHILNIAGHAVVGCASAAASGGKCGAGALSGAAGSFATPLIAPMTGSNVLAGAFAHGVVGGLASVAGGGKFANGAATGAFGYLFNEMGSYAQRGYARWVSGPGNDIVFNPDGSVSNIGNVRAVSLLDDPITFLLGMAPLKGAAVAGEHILLGLRSFGLEELGSNIGARTLLNDANWKISLMEALGNSSTRFTVSLDGFAGATTYEQVMGAASRGLGATTRATEWEMGQLLQAGRLPSTTFMRGGKVVPNPF